MQFAATRDAKFVWITCLFNAQCDVVFEFLSEPRLDLTTTTSIGVMV